VRPHLPTPGGVKLAAVAGLVLLAACQPGPGSGSGSETLCALEATPIAAIQGDSFQSPMLEAKVNVRGVVTLVNDDGFYLESLAPDDSPATSEGLFVVTGHASDRFSEGQVVVTSGTVAERGEGRDTLTSVESLDSWAICERNHVLPNSNSNLPLPPGQREAIEAMRVSFMQPLAVTDVYGLRFGNLRISVNRILPAPTEVARPGDDARERMLRNRDSSIHVRLDRDDEPNIVVGASLSGVTGVMANEGRGPILTLAEDISTAAPPVYRVTGVAENDLRLLSLNLHNYFNGDGRGNGFPTTRGAETPDEFAKQRTRLTATVREIQPDLVAVMELENDGFGPTSAAADFRSDLGRAHPGPWQVIGSQFDAIGADQIAVGLFFRSDRLEPVGAPRRLQTGPFEWGSRVPLAQVFRDLPSGTAFLVVVNHFKSKGSCPDSGPNTNRQDGQGCWNHARVEAARSVIGWVQSLASGEAGGRVLILGDFNAYRMEDPVQAFGEAGFLDLTASAGMLSGYTYVYRGEAGTLDYAFASPQLGRLVRSARSLPINARFPPGIEPEYDWVRSSDHDPVVVDLRFRQSATMP
jgi:predicted extracellular nuclease